MSVVITSNIQYDGKLPNFARDQYATIADMKAVLKKKMPEMLLGYCLEDRNVYLYNKSNTEDETLGLWRKFESGGGTTEDIDIRSCVSADKSYDFETMTHTTSGDTASITADNEYIIFITPYEVTIYDDNGLNNSSSFEEETITVEETTYYKYVSSTQITCLNFNYKLSK